MQGSVALRCQGEGKSLELVTGRSQKDRRVPGSVFKDKCNVVESKPQGAEAGARLQEVGAPSFRDQNGPFDGWLLCFIFGPR